MSSVKNKKDKTSDSNSDKKLDKKMDNDNSDKEYNKKKTSKSKTSSEEKSNKEIENAEIKLKSVIKFFSNRENVTELIRIIHHKKPKEKYSGSINKISLRVYDWFVTNYSKKNNIVYDISTLDENKIKDGPSAVHVYNSYINEMKSKGGKANFDPFKRGEILTLSKSDIEIETTASQLNFFKWAIKNNVVDYVEKNYNNIYTDMIENISTSVNSVCSSESKSRKKRERLSENAINKGHAYDIPIKYDLSSN